MPRGDSSCKLWRRTLRKIFRDCRLSADQSSRLHFSVVWVRQRTFRPGHSHRGKVTAAVKSCGVIARETVTREGRGSRGACPSGVAVSVSARRRPRRTTLLVRRNCCASCVGIRAQMHRGRWRSNDFVRPVLKHGPRSLTCVRVFE